MKNIFWILIFFFTLISSSYSESKTADEIVYETTNEVLERLAADKDRLEQEPEYIKTIVRELIIPHMGFKTMSQLALGDRWQVLNLNEQECFTQAFKNLLIERYSYVLLNYKNQDIAYQSAESIGTKGNISIKQTLTREGVKPLEIKYPMQPENDSWKLIDLVIDDVSLLRSYRKMFNKEIEHKGLMPFIDGFEECA